MLAVIAAGAAVTGCMGFWAQKAVRFRRSMDRCLRLLESGQGAALLPDLRRMVRKHPSDLKAKYCLGRAYAQGGMHREAAAEFEMVEVGNRRERTIEPSELAGQLGFLLRADGPV